MLTLVLYQLTTGEVVVPAVLNSLVQRFFPPVMSKVKMKKKLKLTQETNV